MKTKLISFAFLSTLLCVGVSFAEGNSAPIMGINPIMARVDEPKPVSQMSEGSIPTLSIPSSVEAVTEKEEVMNGKGVSLEKMKQRGLKLVNERINTLNSNAKAIAGSSLTAGQKGAFAQFFENKNADLSLLSTKITSSADATTTKALISSLFVDYRIYGLVIPQIRIQKRIYEIQNHVVAVNAEVFPKIQASLDAQKAKGKDTTQWQKNIDNARTVIANDSTKLSTLMEKVNALTPKDYSATSTLVIKQANKDIRAIAQEINSSLIKAKKPSYLKNMAQGNVMAPEALSSWLWVSSTVNGTTTTPKEGSKFLLSFMKDNHITSSTDCNTIGGSYTASGSAFTFGPMMSTMMYCEGSQESFYSQNLSETKTYSINGKILTFTNDKGSMIFTKKN